MKLILQKILVSCVMMHYGCSILAMHEEPKKDLIEVSSSREDRALATLITTLESSYKPKKDPSEQSFENLCKAAHALDLKKVKELIEKGTSAEYEKKSSLHSVINGLVHKIYCTIEYYGDDNKKIEEAKQQACNVLEYLIESGANIDNQNEGGGTPLMHASFYAQADVVETLLKKGANKDLVTDDGLTAWSNTAERADSYANEYSMSGDPYFFILFSYAKYKDDRKRCNELLKPEEGSKLYERYCRHVEETENEAKLERLYGAALELNINGVKHVLNEGVNFELARRYSFDSSPVSRLLWGVAYSFISSVVTIIKENEAIDDRVSLIIEANKNILEITRTLVSKGLNVDEHGPYGQTALSVAAMSGNVDLVKELLKLGAKKDGEDFLGYSVRDYATIDSQVVKNNLEEEGFSEFVLHYGVLYEFEKLCNAIQKNNKKLEKECCDNISLLVPYKTSLERIHSLLLEEEN